VKQELGRLLLVVVTGMVAVVCDGGSPGEDPVALGPSDELPNIVVILTDDMRRDEIAFMSTLQSELVAPGIEFTNAFVVNPACCPSRASILTGQYSHTHGVYTNVSTNFGGWRAFRSHEGDTLATRLTSRYETALVGKYLNAYHGDGAGDVPPGWDDWVVFADTGGNGGAYQDYSLIVKHGDEPVAIEHYGRGTGPDTYSTDVLAAKAEEIVAGNRTRGEPLFLLFSPYAPHGIPVPADRHADVPVAIGTRPRAYFGPAFNERNVSDKPRYIRQLPRFSKTRVETILESERRRIRTLQAVDEAIGGIVDALGPEATNTLFLFTSDNGYQRGEHRWSFKLVPYEESIHMPFVLRYDPLGLPGGTQDALVANVDIAPTVMDVAEGPAAGMEGSSVLPLLDGTAKSLRQEILIEHIEFRKHGPDAPTYCAVRTKRKLFVRYATGEEELYDLERDPYQLSNAIARRGPAVARVLRRRTRALCSPRPPGMPAF
jgi:arylsulfatase A-like enzyme